MGKYTYVMWPSLFRCGFMASRSQQKRITQFLKTEFTAAPWVTASGEQQNALASGP